MTAIIDATDVRESGRAPIRSRAQDRSRFDWHRNDEAVVRVRVQHHLRNLVSSLSASLAPELFRIDLPRPRLFPSSRSTRTPGALAEVAVGFFGIRGKRNLPLSEEPSINVRDDQR